MSGRWYPKKKQSGYTNAASYPPTKNIHHRGIDLFGGKAFMENQGIAARLETIYEQIKNYPTPIAGCDEQFNFLLSERNRLQNLLTTEQETSVTVE